jgi:cyclase
MHNRRIFPTLTILNDDLVKTINYKNPKYLGDPINAIRLFNNKNIDEICIIDISPRFIPNFKINKKLLLAMAREAFLPLSYGGNILTQADAKEIIDIGFEKVIINSMFHKNIKDILPIVKQLGSQGVVLKIDYTFINNSYHFFTEGKIGNKIEVSDFISKIKETQIGELILSRVDFDGMMNGFDTIFPINIKSQLNIPVVLCHGAKDKLSFIEAEKKMFNNFTSSSIFVYFGNLKAVLINNPFEHE